MSSSRVQVTFAAPLIFLSSDQWTQIRAAISAQFPLRDVVWKPSSRPAVRTIAELHVELVAFETIREELASQIPQSLLEKPFLNLYVVTCDDTDIYKNTVRKQIKDWHASVSQRKSQEWLILLVVRPDNRASAGGFFKSTVLDRIKSDFNADKRDRCVQLVWSQNAIAPQSCTELTSKMKDGLMSAFDSAVSQRSEEIKRSENQRTMPGWNFCTFFILKESLASSFVGMGLPDDAILTYSELEASFLQVQASSLGSQKTISWFGKLINPDPSDDSLPLLDTTKKPYRDLFLSNTISLFDFRVYLLAKHCEVLGLSGKLAEMARKAAGFLGGFAQRLRECDAPLAPYFVESWIFSSALNVVFECERYAASTTLDTQALASYNAAKGELLDLARIQLDKIGIKQGHLPQTPPFSMSLPATSDLSRPSSPTSPTAPTSQQITNTSLLSALTDQDAFDKLYVDTTNRAIEMYIKGGRRKFALRLHGSLAALDLYRARHNQAHQTYTSLPAHYTPHSWNSLATFMQARRLDTHGRLNKPHDREWIETVLAFLKGFVKDDMGADIGLGGEDDVKQYVKGLLDDARKDSEAIEDGVITQEHPMFSVSLRGDVARHSDDQDGSYIDVNIRNSLPCDVDIDAIRITLQGPETVQLVFSSSAQTIPSGSTTITLFCPNPAFGLFFLSTSEISISKLTFKWDHKFHPNRGLYPIASQHSTLVRIPKDFGAVDVKVELPRKIQLDAPQSLLLTIRSGRNDIASSIIKLPPSMGIEFQTAKAEPIAHDEDVTITCDENGVHVSNMEKETEIRVRVPHTYHAGTDPLKVVIDLEYCSSSVAGEPLTRRARFIRQMTTALPLMIQAHDHFRGKSIISDFSISTSPGTYQHLRISHAKLECLEDEQGGLSVTGSRSAKSGIVTVTPTQPAHFLFRVQSETPRTSYASLHLSIGYRLLREEIEMLLTAHTASVLNELLEPHYLLEEIQNYLLKGLENDAEWVTLYNATKELHIKRTALPELPETPNNALVKKVGGMVVDNLYNNRPIEVEDLWHEVIVPVDLPFKNIVTSVNVRINPRRAHVTSETGDLVRVQPLYAGQPIPATLSINASCHWGGPGTQAVNERSYGMRFDVKEAPNDWLISGRKKGDFTAGDGVVYSVPLTLIPLHHGELRLPEVHVYPLPLTSGEMTMGSMALPSAEVYQSHGAEKVLILPRGGRTTFVVGMGS